MTLEQRLFALIPHDKAFHTLSGVVVFIPFHAIAGWAVGLADVAFTLAGGLLGIACGVAL